MTDIKIVPANSKSQKKAFMMLPFDIYKNNKYWVSPLLTDMRYMFGLNGLFDSIIGNKGRHPFYEYGQMQLYLAYKDNRLVGRIAAINNDKYNEIHQQYKTGFFGFFECINDQNVANALFDTAKNG